MRKAGPALLALALAAGPAAAAETVAPTISNLQLTDCEGTFQSNPTSISTGVTSIRASVQDSGIGLRVGRTQHVGGTSALPSLITFLHLDDAGSGTAVSTATLGNNGTPNAALTAVGSGACGSGNGHTGLAGDNCYVWDGDGTTDEILIPASASLNNTTAQITLQAWIFPTVLSAAPILEFNNTTTFGVHLWHSFNGAGKIFANFVSTSIAGPQNNTLESAAGVVQASQWQLVTATYDGSVARLYHNEVLVASRAFGSLTLQTSFDLAVGRRRSSANVFSGRIDEVRVYNAALGADVVAGDHYSGVFEFRTQSGGAQTRVSLVPATHYTPGAFADGGTTLATVTVSNVALRNGPDNTVGWLFQDRVGNTRRTSQGVSVVQSAPDTPVSLGGSVPSTTQIDWSWSRGSRLCLMAGGGAGQFTLRRASDNAVLSGPGTATTFNQGSLTANTLHGARVSATDAFGTSALSAPTSAYTLAAAPTGLSAGSVSTGSAVLSWSSTNPNYTRFEVALSLDNFATVLATRVPIANDLTAVTTGLTGLQPQTTYYVRVRAANGRSSDATTPGGLFSSPLSGVFATLPGAPGTLAASVQGPSSITWSWSAVPTATSYTLEASSGTNLAVTGALTHTVSGLTPNTLYGARLRASNPSGSGAFGPEATAYSLPNPPTGTAVPTVGTATARVTWGANNNPAGTSFQLQLATQASFGTLLSAASVVSTEAWVSGLLPASTYYARVRASGFGGTPSGFDASVQFVTGRFGAVSSTSAPPTPYAFPSQSVAVWHFDESTGTTVRDASIFANHGALSATIPNSTPTFAAGQSGLGNALSFPGLTGSVMTAAHSASLSGTGDLTVEAWVNPSALSQVQDAGIVVKGTGTGEAYMLDVSSSGRWRFGVRDAGASLFAVFSTQSLRANAWTHLAGVYKSGGAPSLSIYVDGTLSNSMSAAPAARRSETGSLSIGNRRSAGASFDRAFRGLIDEVHVQTAALTSAQVGADFASSRPAELAPPAPNDGLRLTVPPNAFGGPTVILVSSSPLTVPISIVTQILSDGLASPPTGHTLVPGSVFEIVAAVGGVAFEGSLGSTVTLAIPYPDADGNGLVDGTFPPIPADTLRMYTLNAAVTQWEALPSSLDAANRRVLGQTTHFSVFALFGPTGIKPNTDQVRLYPRPWRPGSGTKFDSVTFAGRTGLAIDNLPAAGTIRIFTLSGELVRELAFGAAAAGTVIWDGANHAGRRTASGVYFAYVRGDDGSSTVIKFAVER